MATPAKKWPHNADWARLDSIAAARKGRQMLSDCLEETNDPALLRRMARAIEAFREIESKLLSVGPKGEPTHD
jgi:hypothetical protein